MDWNGENMINLFEKYGHFEWKCFVEASDQVMVCFG